MTELHFNWMRDIGYDNLTYDINISIESSDIYKLHNQISLFINGQDTESEVKDIFDIMLDDEEIDTLISHDIIPVIYQPVFDSLQNFVREVHCAIIEKGVVGVSLIFENEQLRRHFYLHKMYEIYRRIYYGRVKDVETFRKP